MDGLNHRAGVSFCLLSTLLLLFLAGLSGSAYASSELEYAKGVIAFSKGNLSEAQKHFKEVVEQDPSNVQARYYLGQVALSSGKFVRAVEIFHRVLKLDPANSAVRLDLALALIKQKDFMAAEKELASVKDKLAHRASVQYYLGYCMYMQGKHEQAIPFLLKAQELGGGFSVSAGYYLGMANLELGKRAQAVKEFRRIATEDSGLVGNMARENLQAISQQDSGKPGLWGMMVSAGAGYDTNVTLETDGNKGSSAPTSFIAMAAWGSPLSNDEHELSLALSFFRSFNFDLEQEGDSLPSPSSLDLTDLAFVLRYRHMSSAGGWWDVSYLLDLDMLDDLGKVSGVAADEGFGVFMLGQVARARYRIFQGQRFATSLEYRFHWRLFYEPLYADQDRDNFGHELALKQELALGDRFRLELALGAVFEDAKGAAWNIWGLNASARLAYQIFAPLRTWASLGWQRSDHFSSENSSYRGHRVDDLFFAGVGISLRVSSWLSLAGSYSFRYNDSNGLPNSPFRYQRHVFQLSLMGRL